jgi:hypothetical protein
MMHEAVRGVITSIDLLYDKYGIICRSGLLLQVAVVTLQLTWEPERY